MAYGPINVDQVSVGDEITVFYRHRGGECGQGGVVTENGSNGITLKAPGDRTFTWWWNEVVLLMCDTPLPKADCLNYDPETCRGPVDMHTTGSSMKAWPRCQHHADERQRSYENSSERWADSDVPPPTLDRYGTGEQWEND